MLLIRGSVKCLALTIGLLSPLAWGAPLGPTARAIIPVDTHQIISVDYRMLRMFETAMTLGKRVLPDNLREFEDALKDVGVNPDTDLDSLTFASFDDERQTPHMVAIAVGSFSPASISSDLRQRKLVPSKNGRYDLYPVSHTLAMTFLDEDLLVLGDPLALKRVLSVREHRSLSIDSDEDVAKVMGLIDKATVWSALDRTAAQRMLLSALGDDPRLASLAGAKEKLLGAYFRMNFTGGIRFAMDVVTSDAASSAALKSLLKMGMLYKSISANPTQKVLLDHVSVASTTRSAGSDSSDLKLQFKADDQQLQILLQSECFAATSTERKGFSGFTSATVTDSSKEMAHTAPKPE